MSEGRDVSQQQPDGIDMDSYDLPAPKAAASRVDMFLEWYGDGRIETLTDGPCPLFARDLQALTSAVRDLLWLHAEAVWLRDRDAAELARWRSGQRRKSWPTVGSVPDGLTYASRLLHEQGTEGGDDHDRILREAAIRLESLDKTARVLLADRDRVEASRQDWAAEAVRLQALIDADDEPAPWDLNHEYRDQGSGDPEVHGACRSCGSDYDDERHEEPYGPRPPEPGPNAPCVCPSPKQLAVFSDRFSRPVCAVHPTQDAAPGPHHPVGSPEGHFQPAPQRDQRRAESTPSCAVHPDGESVSVLPEEKP